MGTDEFTNKLNSIDGSYYGFVAAVLTYVKNNHVVFRTLMSSDQNGGAKTKILTDILAYRKDNLPVFGSDKESKYVYSFIIDGCISMVLKWMDNGFDIDIEELARLMDKLCYMTHKELAV